MSKRNAVATQNDSSNPEWGQPIPLSAPLRLIDTLSRVGCRPMRFHRGSWTGWFCLLAAVPFVTAAEIQSFQLGGRVTYILEPPLVLPQAATKVGLPGPGWVTARRIGSRRTESLGSRVILGIHNSGQLASLLENRPLERIRAVAPGVFLLQAPDALIAIREAASLSIQSGVSIAHPIRRHHASLHAPYSAKPSDRYVGRQWHLENPPSTTDVLGPRADINVRSAWPVTRGQGILIANADDGVDFTHPDLMANWYPELQRNFHTLTDNGSHTTRFQYHGSATAGLHSASSNKIGGIGVAPNARFTSWVIFDNADTIPDEQGMADMFLYASNSVPIQNHSWGNADFEPLIPGTLEYLAVSNAATSGRNGLGTLMVRSAGNTRKSSGVKSGIGDANLDGYANDPHAITVGAVAIHGRAATYSAFGACILVAAPGGESGTSSIFTTDPVGANGRNRQGTFEDPDLADYTANSLGFFGTSAAAPMITGVTALILSTNPNLGYRDVQQILILSARQTDPSDPDARPNGSGFVVSHNTGFGVPDAGVAVRLAKLWPNRPAHTRRSFLDEQSTPIPDDGLHVRVTGDGIPPEYSNFRATGSDGLHADIPTESIPLYNAGTASEPIQEPLTDRAALIQRGPLTTTFRTKLDHAAAAGSPFAIVYNNEGSTERLIMRETEFSPIIGVLLSRLDGEALLALTRTNNTARVQIKLDSAVRSFAVTNTLLCEHVGVRIRYTHSRMGDLRVTLRSPAGTLSVLHRPGLVTFEAPEELTYWTTHHFFESTAGVWTIAVSDEASGIAGLIHEVELILRGVPIVDTDSDGLDDDWERLFLGGVNGFLAADDPDNDGFNNAREFLMQTDPLRNETALLLDVSRVAADQLRLSWPGVNGRTYSVESSETPEGPFQVLRTVPGFFPESGWLFDSNPATQWLRIRE